MSKWEEDCKIIIKCMASPFKISNSCQMSMRSQAVSDRENDPEVFLKRVTPQIFEVYDLGLKYSTPEEWDESFKVLGGSQSRRKSKSILERMTWSQFLYNFNEIISNRPTKPSETIIR